MSEKLRTLDHRAMDGHDPKCTTFRALPHHVVFASLSTFN